MAKVSDVAVGSVFGRLTVLCKFYRATRPNAMYTRCACECGSIKDVLAYALGSATNSCGCQHRNGLVKPRLTHGYAGTRTYRAWKGMWQRCTNPNEQSYKDYKHRTPPSLWKDFSVFLAELGECPTGLTLERLDNAKPYGPGNCVWASADTQSRNRRSTINVSVNGVKMCLLDATHVAGLSYDMVYARLKRQGLSVSQAFGSDNYKEYTA